MGEERTGERADANRISRVASKPGIQALKMAVFFKLLAARPPTRRVRASPRTCWPVTSRCCCRQGVGGPGGGGEESGGRPGSCREGRNVGELTGRSLRASPVVSGPANSSASRRRPGLLSSWPQPKLPRCDHERHRMGRVEDGRGACAAIAHRAGVWRAVRSSLNTT